VTIFNKLIRVASLIEGAQQKSTERRTPSLALQHKITCRHG